MKDLCDCVAINPFASLPHPALHSRSPSHLRALSLTLSLQAMAKDNSWTFLMMTQRWPATACDMHHSDCAVPSDVNYFTVHGLWPNRDDGYPSFCTHEKMDQHDVAPILTQMQEYWTNYFSNSKPLSFWEHEWEKHGTCASNVAEYDTPEKYFEAGLKFRSKFDWKAALAKHNIVPSNKKTYTYDAIVKAAESEFGGTAVVKCEHTKLGQVLAQAVTCIGKDGNTVSCDSIHSNCNMKEEIYMPVIQHTSEDAVSYQSHNNVVSPVGDGSGKDANQNNGGTNWTGAVTAISCVAGVVAVAGIVGAVWLKNKREERAMGASNTGYSQALLNPQA